MSERDQDALAAMSESEFQLHRNWSAANFIFFTSTIVDEDIATAYILINSKVIQFWNVNYAN